MFRLWKGKQYYDINLLEKSFADLGIQIKSSDGSYVCWEDIFEQLSEIYKNCKSET